MEGNRLIGDVVYLVLFLAAVFRSWFETDCLTLNQTGCSNWAAVVLGGRGGGFDWAPAVALPVTNNH